MHNSSLLITGLLLTAALAGVCGYQVENRLKMVATQFNFVESVQMARDHMNAATLKAESGLPGSSGAWIALFNQKVPFAPEGGPAFIVNKQGNPKTGAIGISATDFGQELRITRPSYAILTEQTAVVRTSGKILLVAETKPQKQI